ncbi:MAG: hypothetical protein DRP02_13975 [Candidatus Gerdarchaeota archaeon]|nr:MAG: hypothetical protein DRP02_13975 [Candidatus Gerdarchaeota archaeon]
MWGFILDTISPAKKSEIYDLVKKQKKARLNWVATICQISEEELVSVAPEIGLLIEGEFICIASASTNQQCKRKRQFKREQIIASIINDLYYSYNPNPVGSDILPLVTVFFLPSSEILKTIEKNTQQTLTVLRSYFTQLTDDGLKIFITVEDYLQKIFLPKFTGKISSELERELLLEAKAIDYQLSLEANEIAANSIHLKKKFLGLVKKYEIHFPGGGISEVPARDFYDVKKAYLKILLSMLREKFYRTTNFEKEIQKRISMKY